MIPLEVPLSNRMRPTSNNQWCVSYTTCSPNLSSKGMFELCALIMLKVVLDFPHINRPHKCTLVDSHQIHIGGKQVFKDPWQGLHNIYMPNTHTHIYISHQSNRTVAWWAWLLGLHYTLFWSSWSRDYFILYISTAMKTLLTILEANLFSECDPIRS